MKAVSDATPLIYLSKIGCVHFLKEVFEEIVISEGIYDEVIVKGKEKGENDILLIEEFIKEKFIIIKKPRAVMEIDKLDRGEKESISLCKELKISTILIDERAGFSVAQMLNLIPIRTTSVFVILLDRKIINLNKYKELLKLLPEKGYFLDAQTYQKLLSIGETLGK